MRAEDQRINVHRGGRLEIVAPFASWQRWQAACSAARELGKELGVEIIVRAADTTGWHGRWIDGRPR